MDFSILNEKQLEAVYQTEGAVLVLAGAGSGKTRVLTHRISHLIVDKKVKGYSILAITFTNRAANEMKERLSAMVGDNSGVWVSTFHSLCARILRSDIERLGYTKSYTIYADDDSMRVIKRVLVNKHIEVKGFADKVRWHISNAKTLIMSPNEYMTECCDNDSSRICDVYAAYEEELANSNALDYDDLLLKTYRLFNEYPEVLAKYSQRFEYIHIDEYQDTSKLQYKLAAMLASVYGNLFAVGDEDQSIYSWRGADISNILDFKKDFKDAKIIKLEQNYRSTPNILQAANALICNNHGRFDKKLWTDASSGVRVEIYNAGRDDDEAEYVVSQIAMLIRDRKYKPSDFAILVRLNALTRKFEERLRLYNIQYRVYGGFKFYERKEIKDVLAYFRAVANPRDNDALLRIINTPKRGIGDTVISALSEYVRDNGVSVADIILGDIQSFGFANAMVRKLGVFRELYSKLLSGSANMGLKEFVDYIVEEAGFKREYNSGEEEDLNKLMNIGEFKDSVISFADSNPEASLEDFLESISLLSASDDVATEECVTISTVHSVKGLEFKTVFVTALEENIFPSGIHTKSNAEIEEERRVMYVAVTRARERLYLTCARSRFRFDGVENNMRSRFLCEIEEVIAPKRVEEAQRSGITGMYNRLKMVGNGDDAICISDEVFSAKKDADRLLSSMEKPKQTAFAAYSAGQKVEHPRYGIGMIVDIRGDNASIAFQGLGIKQFNTKIAPLKVVR